MYITACIHNILELRFQFARTGRSIAIDNNILTVFILALFAGCIYSCNFYTYMIYAGAGECVRRILTAAGGSIAKVPGIGYAQALRATAESLEVYITIGIDLVIELRFKLAGTGLGFAVYIYFLTDFFLTAFSGRAYCHYFHAHHIDAAARECMYRVRAATCGSIAKIPDKG